MCKRFNVQITTTFFSVAIIILFLPFFTALFNVIISACNNFYHLNNRIKLMFFYLSKIWFHQNILIYYLFWSAFFLYQSFDMIFTIPNRKSSNLTWIIYEIIWQMCTSYSEPSFMTSISIILQVLVQFLF